MCFKENWIYKFTLANNVCLLGHLDELQKAEKYTIMWSAIDF